MLTQIFKLLFDASAVDRGLAHVDKASKKVGGSLAKELTGRIAGAFAAGAVIDRLVKFTGAVIDNADALDEMSDLLNMSIEDIQRLQVAANLAGVPFRKLKGILDGIAAAQAQALTGDKSKMALFSNLGLNPATATALQVLEAAAGARAGTPAAAAAADILGRKMNDVLGVMRALKGLGPVDLITTEQGKRIAQAKDDLEEAGRRLKVAATPAITAGLDVGATAFRGINRMFKGQGGTLFTSLFTQLGADAMDKFLGADGSPLPLPPGKQRGPQPPPLPEAARAAIPLGVSGDSLARIGLFAGGRAGAGERLVSIAASQLAAQRTTNRLLAQLADNQ